MIEIKLNGKVEEKLKSAESKLIEIGDKIEQLQLAQNEAFLNVFKKLYSVAANASVQVFINDAGLIGIRYNVSCDFVSNSAVIKTYADQQPHYELSIYSCNANTIPAIQEYVAGVQELNQVIEYFKKSDNITRFRKQILAVNKELAAELIQLETDFQNQTVEVNKLKQQYRQMRRDQFLKLGKTIKFTKPISIEKRWDEIYRGINSFQVAGFKGKRVLINDIVQHNEAKKLELAILKDKFIQQLDNWMDSGFIK